MTGCCNFLCDLACRQVAAFAGLCALTNFDLDQVRGVDRFRRNAEAAGRNLNAAVERIFAKQVGISPPSPLSESMFKRNAASA